MRDSRLLQVLCPPMLAGAGTAYDERLSDVTGPMPNLTTTFTSIQREIFNTWDSSGRLACIQCHTTVGRTPTAGLNLVEGAADASLVGRPSVNNPGATFVIPARS
jgi:hypothetical protein